MKLSASYIPHYTVRNIILQHQQTRRKIANTDNNTDFLPTHETHHSIARGYQIPVPCAQIHDNSSWETPTPEKEKEKDAI